MKMSNYSSSSGDILTMENKQGLDTSRSWNEEWNAVFHHFIDRNATKLLRTYYAGLVRAWQKKPEGERKPELAIANKVIARSS